ncbi:Membrane transport protein MerF [Pleurocapsa sp. PCC 7327]|uniref:mercury resistance system transport protein MerF n=1 Tax=Pleurocapsa sp. PCC 7327 TaxID=118163 RepID=UPI00029FE435|nr:mercury resistance system transport protein MerF [Pleurocapsa sp. PCC 7327]AFY75703.1 Membrane transport protein MerF [Pleurocapsa sp. PCC 7327]
MKPKNALIASLTGTVIVALCCFTPILVILLEVVGLSAVVGYLDYVLLPALGILVALTVLFYFRYRKSNRQDCCK